MTVEHLVRLAEKAGADPVHARELIAASSALTRDAWRRLRPTLPLRPEHGLAIDAHLARVRL
ncbi:MAG: hypothetical protein HY909_24815 [Deltaproteobacteria bacterium]|nr:hypothetical protein [Deltaproteobacteria bacterium]